ncbi:MAG: hypothetical protein HC919_11255 [Oscillatoriales cyanobacterium SM2_2_1]|nr:hypothetical protein [Oscillatoriales cyanobacterium SM2_2_1]
MAVALGWAIATAISLAAGAWSSSQWHLELLPGLAVTHFLMAAMQTVVLRFRLSRPLWWVPFSCLGGVLSGLGSSFFAWRLSVHPDLTIDYLLSYPLLRGGILGLSQYPLLRQHSAYAMGWIPWSAISWWIGFRVALTVMPSPHTTLILGLVYGGLTGLYWIIPTGPALGIDDLPLHDRRSRHP